MREASLEDITKFLKCNRVAFVGVSRNSQHFSRALFREFLARGYDAVPVNPQATEIEGRTCFARISDIDPVAESALLITGASKATDQAVRDCHQAAIRNIWIYKSVCGSADHEQAMSLTRSHGAAIVEGYCPFMFLPQPAFIHRIHRFMTKATGCYPH